MIHTPTLDELRAYAAPLVERQRAAFMRRIMEERYLESGHRSIGGGAPQLPVTLAILPAAATVNTFTTAQSLLHATAAAGPLGPYSADYFKTVGATWQQEAAGVISTTGTPTFIMGTYFGVAVGTITTVLCVTPTLTTASGLANFPWYYSSPVAPQPPQRSPSAAAVTTPATCLSPSWGLWQSPAATVTSITDRLGGQPNRPSTSPPPR